jgi:hypothetical protein
VQKKARDAFTDYLGCYFLGLWMKDIVFRDSVIDMIIKKMNVAEGKDCAGEFVKVLKPSIVDLVTTNEYGSRGIRALMFIAIGKWGTREDLARLVPTEGDTVGRSFVRGLLGHLLIGVQDGWLEMRNECHIDDGEENDEEEEGSGTPSVWTSTETTVSDPCAGLGLGGMPQSFMANIEDIWTRSSHVSWPSVQSDSESVTGNNATSGTLIPKTVLAESNRKEGSVGWPEKEEDYCMFHEHTFSGLPCYRQMMRWDIHEQKMYYDAFERS